jgi:adenylate kinase family enzyme
MKSKLIILNGPLGIGKSTLAKRYAKDHPLTLVLDIDEVWAMLSNWREEKEVSAPLSKQLALEMARVTLKAGHDVIVPQILQTSELADSFEKLTRDCGAQYYEILLIVDKDESIRRFIERGKSSGNPTGFRAGGNIDTGGRETKLAEMYDKMIEVSSERPNVIKIEPLLGNVEGTYTDLVKQIKID